MGKDSIFLFGESDQMNGFKYFPNTDILRAVIVITSWFGVHGITLLDKLTVDQLVKIFSILYEI